MRLHLLFSLLCGCTVEPIDLSGRTCPCASGWLCDAITNTCHQFVFRDAGPFDAGRAVDAGAIDAAMIDAGAPPASSCEPLALRSDILVCDGFEDGLGDWALREDTGTVELETSTVRRGARAMRNETNVMQVSGRADAITPPWTMVSSGELHYRMWLRVPSDFVEENFALLITSEDVAPYDGFAVHLRAGGVLSLYSALSGVNLLGDASVPRDEWFCLQLAVRVDDVAGSYSVRVDGVEVIAQGGLDTRPSMGYSGAAIGIAWTSESQGPATVYVDEVAIATSAIPCE